MASYTTIEDWKDVESGYVVDVTIRQTDDEQYPSGWDYALHLGQVGGDTVFASTTPTNGRRATNATLGMKSRSSSSLGC